MYYVFFILFNFTIFFLINKIAHYFHLEILEQLNAQKILIEGNFLNDCNDVLWNLKKKIKK